MSVRSDGDEFSANHAAASAALDAVPGGVPPIAVFEQVLVVDDDPDILHMVEEKLDYAGYDVWTARSGEEALAVIDRRGLPSLAIVDLLMPGMGGFEFCQTVQRFADLPVIVLTAVDEEETIIQGISLFAEDYVTKPFSPRELLARVGRVLRRINQSGGAGGLAVLVDERLVVELAKKKAVVDGRGIHLTPTETKLLHILMRNRGRVVTMEFLLRRVWPLDDVFEDTLRVHIHRLRDKIEPEGGHPRYILTERGLGYRFMAR